MYITLHKDYLNGCLVGRKRCFLIIHFGLYWITYHGSRKKGLDISAWLPFEEKKNKLGNWFTGYTSDSICYKEDTTTKTSTDASWDFMKEQWHLLVWLDSILWAADPFEWWPLFSPCGPHPSPPGPSQCPCRPGSTPSGPQLCPSPHGNTSPAAHSSRRWPCHGPPVTSSTPIPEQKAK